jgi:hypothetical protein
VCIQAVLGLTNLGRELRLAHHTTTHPTEQSGRTGLSELSLVRVAHPTSYQSARDIALCKFRKFTNVDTSDFNF